MVQLTELVRYLQALEVTQGRLAGQRLQLLPWQRKFLLGAFAPNTTTAALSVARGNGKTALLSAVACAALNGPLAVTRGEVVLVASSFEQARIAFEHVLAFLGDVRDRNVWRVWDSAQLARIDYLPLQTRVRCLASDPRRAHGLAPVLVLADEPSQWPTNTAEAMVAALQTAAGKQPHSRFVALGTRPVGGDHWFARMLEGGVDYAQVHAAEPNDPPFSVRTWRKANPSLQAMPDLQDALRREASRAKRDPATMQAFRALRLNLGVSDVVESLLLPADVWLEIEVDEVVQTGPYALGLDLGQNVAMTAAAAYWPQSGTLDAFAVFPELPGLSERGLADGVGDLYRRCAERGELLQAGSRVSDVSELLRHALERWGRPAIIVADRWKEAELRQALERVGFPLTGLVVRGMGYKDGGEDVRRFREACLDGRVSPVRSLLLRSAMAGARTVTDEAGNAKLAKGGEGRRQRARDDAVAAAILAVAEGSRRREAHIEASSGVVLVEG